MQIRFALVLAFALAVTPGISQTKKGKPTTAAVPAPQKMDEEYTGLKQLCLVKRARSVSDLARSAMSTLLSDGPRDSDKRVEDMRLLLSTLDRKIDLISARLASERRVE